MRAGPTLLQTLLMAIAAHGLSADSLTPWRGWLVFKQYVRSVAEAPDPGVSVQITKDDPEADISLLFVRQVVEPLEDWLEPIGGVVCEMTFKRGRRPMPDWQAWSFEAPSFDRFVDVVEGNAAFQDLVVRRPRSSAVYWVEV